uniref:Uncharacterized protein n=1 Tax=Anguilla anguilla TaxID=7936 RepID=A0A0E9QHE7_ANGAN
MAVTCPVLSLMQLILHPKEPQYTQCCVNLQAGFTFDANLI